jgi:hypothetical protein
MEVADLLNSHQIENLEFASVHVLLAIVLAYHRKNSPSSAGNLHWPLRNHQRRTCRQHA